MPEIKIGSLWACHENTMPYVVLTSNRDEVIASTLRFPDNGEIGDSFCWMSEPNYFLASFTKV